MRRAGERIAAINIGEGDCKSVVGAFRRPDPKGATDRHTNME
jgi:hypothetical protein